MGIDLQGIARLVGATDGGAPRAAAPADASGFVTTVRRAGEIAPFETVVKQVATEQAKAAAGPGTVEGAEAFKAKNAEKARKQFEAFALQVFIGSMLPQENNKMFGTGSAGKLWQSLMAEKLADQITSSGRLRLLPDNATATAPATAASAPAAAPVEARKTEPSGKAR
jgi:hypothetical protein